MIKRILAIIILILISSFLLNTDYAKASNYVPIPITSNLDLNFRQGGYDFTNNWKNICTDTNHPYYYKKSGYYNYDEYSETDNTFCNILSQVDNGNYGYIVSVYSNVGNDELHISIFPKNTNINVAYRVPGQTPDYILTIDTVSYVRMNLSHYHSNFIFETQHVYDLIFLGENFNYGQTWGKIFTSKNVNFIYPDDWDGIAIPTEKKDLYPSISYNVEQKTAKFTYHGTHPQNISKPHKFRISATGADSVEKPSTDNLFTINFKDNGTYKLKVEIIDDENNLSDYNLKPIYLNITINNTYFSSNSITDDCYGDSECTTSTPYQECSALDFMCYLDNVGVFLKSFIMYLFIPDMAKLEGYAHELGSNLEHNTSLFFAPIQFIFTVFKTAGADRFYICWDNSAANSQWGESYCPQFSTPDCSITVPLFGTTASMPLCAWRNQMPEMWDLLQNLLRAFMSIMLLMFIWRKTADIFGLSGGEFTDDDDEFSDGEMSGKGDGFGSRNKYIKGSKK